MYHRIQGRERVNSVEDIMAALASSLVQSLSEPTGFSSGSIEAETTQLEDPHDQSVIANTFDL